jgi:hypothetical protein
MWKLGTMSIALAFAAMPARGQELIFGANVGGRWDSNVFSTPSAESDFSVRVGPEVRLRETQGNLTYDFHYVPTYQAYSRFAALDDWDQLVTSTVSYQLGLNTTLSVSDIFDYAPVATNFLQQVASPVGVPQGTQTVNAVGRYNVLVNTVSLGLDHRFSELWHGVATVNNFYYDPRIENGVSTNITTGTGGLTYNITQIDEIGASAGFTSQQFGSNNFQNGTTNYYYNGSAIWNHLFSPTWSLKMSAGPTYVQSAAYSIPSTTFLRQGPFQSISSLSSSQNALFELSPPASPLNACTFTSFPGPPSGSFLLNQCNGSPTLPLNSAAVPPSLLNVLTPTARELAASSVPVFGLTPGSHSSLTYFANILLSKSWETVTGSVGYSRSAGSTNLGGSNSEVDSFSGNLTWTATPLWTSYLSVIFVDQSSSVSNTVAIRAIVQPFQYTATGSLVSAGLVPASAQTPQVTGLFYQQGNGTIHLYQWIVGVHSEYQLTKRLRVFGSFFFLNQTASSQGNLAINLSNSNINSARFDLGLHYEFDPIHL